MRAFSIHFSILRCFSGATNYDPEFPSSEDGALKVRTRNATQLLAAESSDWGISPTQWQLSRYPGFVRERTTCVHDGIDTHVVKPDANARFKVGNNGAEFGVEDEVLTYCARNLEPYRGFHSFMRALPDILERRPKCHVLVVGADDVSYGRRLPKGTTYRQKYLEEVKPDLSRVHFLGRLPYAKYLRVLQVSSTHVYLTYPFVLSWSCMEAMAAGGLLVGANTEPVREVIEDGKNGLLVDMLAPEAVAEKTVQALAMAHDKDKQQADEFRAAARKRIVDAYDFKSICMPTQENVLRQLADGKGRQ